MLYKSLFSDNFLTVQKLKISDPWSGVTQPSSVLENFEI